MVKVKICDAMMGTGKTTAAINYMNEHPNERYLYITPLLEEDDRIAKACPTLNFYKPERKVWKKVNKLDDFHRLLKEKRNIVSTHALFSRYSEETLDLIKEGGYTLILDEVMDVVSVADPIHPLEMKHLFEDGIIKVGKGGKVEVHDEIIDKTHSSWDRVQTFKDKPTIFDEDCFFMYEIPINRFDVFKEVFVLTYMFDCQVQKYYYDIFGYEYEYLYIKRYDKYEDARFTANKSEALILHPDKRLFNIVEDSGLNDVGVPTKTRGGSLSLGGYLRDTGVANKLSSNLNRLYFKRWRCPEESFLWTTYKKFKKDVEFKGIENSFLSCNAKGTNAYSNRSYLAYLIDKYPNPLLVRYFSKHDVRIDRDSLALSQMLQWIYRSAIRNGEPIRLYIPSKRMRELLYGWLGVDNTKLSSPPESLLRYVGEYIPVKSDRGRELAECVSKIAGETLTLSEACRWVEGHYDYVFVKDRIRIDRVKYVCVKLMAL